MNFPEELTDLVNRLNLLSEPGDDLLISKNQIERIREGFLVGISGKGGVCLYDVTSSNHWEWMFGYREGEKFRQSGKSLSQESLTELFHEFLQRVSVQN